MIPGESDMILCSLFLPHNRRKSEQSEQNASVVSTNGVGGLEGDLIPPDESS